MFWQVYAISFHWSFSVWAGDVLRLCTSSLVLPSGTHLIYPHEPKSGKFYAGCPDNRSSREALPVVWLALTPTLPTTQLGPFHTVTVERHTSTKLLSQGCLEFTRTPLNTISGINECQRQLTLKTNSCLIPHLGVETGPDMLIYLLQLISILMLREILAG